MKLTTDLKRWVSRVVAEYCKKMKLRTPDLIFEIYHADKMRDWDVFGMYYDPPLHCLFVNVRMHENKLHLRYTMAHELNHAKNIYRKKKMRHGKVFDDYVDKIIGRRVPVN